MFWRRQFSHIWPTARENDVRSPYPRRQAQTSKLEDVRSAHKAIYKQGYCQTNGVLRLFSNINRFAFKGRWKTQGARYELRKYSRIHR